MINTEVRHNLRELTRETINRNTPRHIKMVVLESMFNTNYYDFLGFDANGSVVRLQPRFHNVRDETGRFVSYHGK